MTAVLAALGVPWWIGTVAGEATKLNPRYWRDAAHRVNEVEVPPPPPEYYWSPDMLPPVSG